MSFNVCPSSSGKRNFIGSTCPGVVSFGSRKVKGCNSGSRTRSRAGPVSPFSAISFSSSVKISLMIRLTTCPCKGTSPLTEMCKRQSIGSTSSMSRPLTPRPLKNTRAPLSLSILLWWTPPRPMMRLSILEPYMPLVRSVSKKIFSDQGYLFSGIAGGGSFGNLGVAYGFGGGPGGGGGVTGSVRACFAGGCMLRIDIARSCISPGKSACCSARLFTKSCTS
mmetsp:Transcript_61165/g.162523  ORF Transcript_61165/g.162523 Transcript_61165/m.162523 type:complete len:222 (-) Transcript_61165:3842-4507(-)